MNIATQNANVTCGRLDDLDAVGLLLAGRPTAQAWERMCGYLELLAPGDLASVAPRVLAWPGRIREMPDRWWAQWLSGDRRPCHALAARRLLGDLDDVENGGVTWPVGDDGPDDTDLGDGCAYFYHGATVVACPDHLRWLVLGAAAEWHHNGGDIVRWNTSAATPPLMLLDGGDYHDEALDLQLSPDGSLAVTSVEGRLLAWTTTDGEPRWEAELDGADDIDDFVRIGFSADGRLLAVGTTNSAQVLVLRADTGEEVLDVPDADGEVFGPVALDGTGRRLAHCAPGGRVVVRDVGTGEVTLTQDTGLICVNALTFAPDGMGLLAAGGAVGGVPADAGLATEARPAACVFTLGDGSRTGSVRQVFPTRCPEKLDAESPFARMATRAVWTRRGPCVFVAGDYGAVVFDGAGRTVWESADGVVAGFSADGRVLVTVGQEVEAWFLDGLPPAAVPPVPEEEPAGSRVLLSDVALAEPDGSVRLVPCSRWTVRTAAAADGLSAFAFTGKLRCEGDELDLVVWRDGRSRIVPVPAEDAGNLSDLAFSPAGDLLVRAVAGAVAGEEPLVTAHDPETGERRWRVSLGPLPAASRGDRLHVGFSGDGRRLAAASHATGRVLVIDAASGEVLLDVTQPPQYTDVWKELHADKAALDARGRLVAYGARDSRTRVIVREVASGKIVFEAEPDKLRQVTGLAFAPDGSRLAVGGSIADRAAIWTLALDRRTTRRRVEKTGMSLYDQPYGELVWASTGPRGFFPGDGRGLVLDASSSAAKTLVELPFGCSEGAAALTPDGRALLAVTQYGVRAWDLEEILAPAG